MPEIGPEYPVTYRQELVTPLFQRLQAGESCVVVGAASMGKSRLLQFLLRSDVRQHYWGKQAESSLFIWIDCNRMAVISEWGLYELILTALIEGVGQWPPADGLRSELNQYRKEVILTGNALLAQRYVELAARMLCREQGLRLCLVLDEFDEGYRILPGQILANLRALRDANKYSLHYVLFIRDHPAQLRDPDECEGFYELLSRSVLGLKPHCEEDTRRIIQNVATRRAHELAGPITDDTIAQLTHLSGGHPGLLVTLIDALIVSPPIGLTWLAWAENQPGVWEECRKIWEGLRNEEQRTLNHAAQGVSTGFRERQSLIVKGLLREEHAHQPTFFSPLFADYAAQRAPASDSKLRVDAQTGVVWVNSHQSESLTAKEFKLLAYLDEHLGEICEVDQLIACLYPGAEGYEVNDNAIAALVKRVREKIEPNPKRPHYLLNVKGRGYRLVAEPE